MENNKPYDPNEFDDLVLKIDALTKNGAPAQAGDDFDLIDFASEDLSVDEGVVYQNYSNGYGGSAPRSAEQAYNPEMTGLPQDRGEYRDYGGKKKPTIAAQKAAGTGRKRRRPGKRGCGCATALMVLAALVAAMLLFVGSFFEMPQAEEALGERKENTAAILLCGTDKDGTRTDTMMLVYLDGEENRIGLLSLPRDTLTRTSTGKRAKLNSAYGRNGCGVEGMEWTMNYVQDIIGYRPDGYILVDMELVPRIVDLMGGDNDHLDHHIRVHTVGVEVYVPAGDQHLNGEEVLATLRYRYGYANADLGRVEVQRMVITECMKQWVNPLKLALLPDALELIQEESLTDLSVGNFLWIGKTILAGMNDMTSDTLPGYADMRGGASYFVLYPDQVAQLINESYNPYHTVIDADALDIAE